MQAALPEILEKVPPEYKKRNLEFLERNAHQCFEGLKNVPGLHPVMPAGAMYMMVSLCCVRHRTNTCGSISKYLLYMYTCIVTISSVAYKSIVHVLHTFAAL